MCKVRRRDFAGLCFTLKTIELLLALKKKKKKFEHRQQNSDPIFCAKGNRTREVKWIEWGHSAAKAGPEHRSCLLVQGSLCQVPSSRRPLGLKGKWLYWGKDSVAGS